MLATGRIVGDYEPLYRYWEEAEKAGRGRLVLEREDMELVERRVREGGRVNLQELMVELRRRIAERVDPELAARAYKALGLDIPPEVARVKIAEIVAGWAIEACTSLGIVSVKGLL